jgi:hypothetical protein
MIHLSGGVCVGSGKFPRCGQLRTKTKRLRRMPKKAGQVRYNFAREPIRNSPEGNFVTNQGRQLCEVQYMIRGRKPEVRGFY